MLDLEWAVDPRPGRAGRFRPHADQQRVADHRRHGERRNRAALSPLRQRRTRTDCCSVERDRRMTSGPANESPNPVQRWLAHHTLVWTALIVSAIIAAPLGLGLLRLRSRGRSGAAQLWLSILALCLIVGGPPGRGGSPRRRSGAQRSTPSTGRGFADEGREVDFACWPVIRVVRTRPRLSRELLM